MVGEIQYDTDIQYLKGVGPKLASLLAGRHIHKVRDLLEWYPRAYEDRREARNIRSLKADELVSLVATVRKVSTQPLGRGHRKMYIVLLGDESGFITCKFFRTPYKGYFERFQAGTKVRVIGKTTLYRNNIEFHHPDLRDFEEAENDDRVVAIYTETDGLPPRKVRSILTTALEGLKGKHIDPLPSWLKQKYNLIGREEAITKIHLPPQQPDPDFLLGKSIYHERLIFDEFFWLELYLASKKSGVEREIGPVVENNLNKVELLQKSLPFELTNAQKKSFEEIKTDMLKPHPMHRLVQGDVGSGKTVVAMMAAVFAADSGLQTALMVPTEILANQHFKSATKLLEPLGIKVGMVTGMQKAKEKRENLEKIASGEFQFVIGTHALIQDQIEFNNLGLVIIDEQHRFGVGQRNILKQKGISPHFLIMTATPIPRTLSMTVYGDLDVSIINEMPKGRIPITTKVVYDSKRNKVFDYMAEQVGEGRQAYIVYPLVEESEKIDLKDAVSQFEELVSKNTAVKFGLLHGKMKEVEKDQTMELFRKNEIHVLVSTTVIEVGVDVPNANMIIIEHTERFGLSQLHQLRGRVGRGQHKSYCVLLLGYAVSEESKHRADVMASTNDGFEIANEDLKLRGAGEILGTRQSGLAGFKLANLITDTEILMRAREAAFEIFKKDPLLKSAEHQALRAALVEAHGPTALAGVG